MNCVWISTVKPAEAADVFPYKFLILGVVFTCVVMAVIVYVLCRKPGLSHKQHIFISISTQF